MAVPNAHALYHVLFNATALGGITRQSITLGNRVQSEPSSGDITSRFVALYQQAPTARLTTVNVADAMTLIGTSGLAISTLAAGLILYANKKAEGGVRATGANHRKYVMREGIIVPRTLNAPFGADATLDIEAFATYDGSNLPIVATDSISLPTGAADAERFTLRKATIGAAAITGIQGITIDFGVGAFVMGSDGDLYPTFSSIDTIAPSVTLRGVDINWLASGVVPLLGLAATHANTTIYLQKRSPGGTFVADGTAEHIKFTVAGLATVQNAFDAGGNENATCDIAITPNFDGTNLPITVDAASAIS